MVGVEVEAVIRREDPRAAEICEPPGAEERNRKYRRKMELIQHADCRPQHLQAVERVSREPGRTQHDGKPRKTDPKLMPWDVLKRVGITREEVAGRIWRDSRPNVWDRLRLAGIENRRMEGKSGCPRTNKGG
jgi:hypothetical protein